MVGADLGDDVGHLPTENTKYSYGGFSDKWGTTWTPSEINASGFGIEICPKGFGTGVAQVCAIDYVKITVCYAGAYGHKFVGVDKLDAKKMLGVLSTAVARILGV
jgi:hypothetical protein